MSLSKTHYPLLSTNAQPRETENRLHLIEFFLTGAQSKQHKQTNTACYNTDLDITRSCGSQTFFPWNFTKELSENVHGHFPINSFVKLLNYNTIQW